MAEHQRKKRPSARARRSPRVDVPTDAVAAHPADPPGNQDEKDAKKAPGRATKKASGRAAKKASGRATKKASEKAAKAVSKARGAAGVGAGTGRRPSARSRGPSPKRSPLSDRPARSPAGARGAEDGLDQGRPERDGAVLITGICGRMGRLLARRLHRVGSVIGVDRRPFEGCPKDIVHHQMDLRRKKTRDLFRSGKVRAVVHLGVLHDPRKSDKEHHSWNVVAFQKLLEYLAQYDVPKLVVLSSANVYGPQPDNPQFLTEEAPLLGAQSFRAIRDLVELDMLAQSFFWRHPRTQTVILRPCHILGGVHNGPSNYLRMARPITIMGYDPMMQLIHESDVVDAMIRALRPGVRGIFNLRGPGELPLSRVLRMLGRQPVAVPAPVAQSMVKRLWKYHLTSFPPAELDHIRYNCMVDDSRARETLDFRPMHGVRETVMAVDTLT